MKIFHDIVRTIEHAAIYRTVGAAMRGHSLMATMLIGAGIILVCVLCLSVRRR